MSAADFPLDSPEERLLEAKRTASFYDAKLGAAMVARRSAIAALFTASTAYADATYLEGVAQQEADAAWKAMDAAADAIVAAGLPDPRQQEGGAS